MDIEKAKVIFKKSNDIKQHSEMTTEKIIEYFTKKVEKGE